MLGLSTVREDEPPMEYEEAEAEDADAADEEQDPEVAAARSLRAQADALQDAVVAAEQRLGRLRQRHAALLDKLARAENGVQSRLAKYSASLRALNDEIAEFLAREDDRRDPAAVAGGQRSGRRAVALEGARRRRTTLELARERWAARQAGLERGLQGARREREALEEGAAVWTESVAAIDGFERKMQAELARLAGAGRATTASSSAASHGRASSPDRAESMVGLVADMSSTMAFVAARLRLARKRDWRLLQACIGAELEAFRQGRAALERAAGLQHTPPAEDEEEDDDEHEQQSAENGRGYDGREEEEDSAGSFRDDTVYEDARGDGEDDATARDLLGPMAPDAAAEGSGIELDRRKKGVELVFDDDDGPGPELLVGKPRSDSE